MLSRHTRQGARNGSGRYKANIQASGYRYYIWVGKDAFDGAVYLSVAESRKMDEVLWFLGECWKNLSRPEQVQWGWSRY